jgi:predicted MFS family arabinose efflux permease
VQLFTGLLFGFIVWRALKGVFTDAGAPARFSRAQVGEMVALVKNPAFLGVSAATGLLQMGRLVVLTFLPIYLQEHLGYSAFALGVYIALLHVLGIFSQAVLGALSDRFGRKAVLVPSCIALGILFGLLAVVPPGVALGLVIVAIGLFFYTLFNVMNAAVMDVAGSSIQASTYGLTYVIMQVIVIPTPVLTGLLIGEFGIRSSFFLAGAFLVLSGLVLAPLELYRGTGK